MRIKYLPLDLIFKIYLKMASHKPRLSQRLAELRSRLLFLQWFLKWKILKPKMSLISLKVDGCAVAARITISSVARNAIDALKPNPNKISMESPNTCFVSPTRSNLSPARRPMYQTKWPNLLWKTISKKRRTRSHPLMANFNLQHL